MTEGFDPFKAPLGLGATQSDRFMITRDLFADFPFVIISAGQLVAGLGLLRQSLLVGKFCLAPKMQDTDDGRCRCQTCQQQQRKAPAERFEVDDRGRDGFHGFRVYVSGGRKTSVLPVFFSRPRF